MSMNMTWPDGPSASTASVTGLVIAAGIMGLLFAAWQYYLVAQCEVESHASPSEEGKVGDKLINGQSSASDEQTKSLVEIHAAIDEGATAFLFAEYKYVTIFVFFFSILVFVLVGSAKNCGALQAIAVNGTGSLDFAVQPCWTQGAYTAVAFIVGAGTSIICGFIGMKVAVYANVRTCVSAQVGWTEAFNIAFRAGSVMGFALCSIGLLVMYALISGFNTHWLGVAAMTIPRMGLDSQGMARLMFEAIAGFGLGGSAVALFGRVGGGIYTKAADVGADLVGKVEKGIPEDDPRNPAVIADNVGDNVGDVAGMGADLFGSFAESSCAALVVASTSPDLNRYWPSLMFPLVVSAVGIITCIFVCLIGTNVLPVREEAHIERNLRQQLIFSTLFMTPVLAGMAKVFLPDQFCVSLRQSVPSDFLAAAIANDFPWQAGGVNVVDQWCRLTAHWYSVFICVAIGLWGGLVIGYYTDYMTSFNHAPVQELASVCDKGAAVNIIYGLALGQLSTGVPVTTLAITIFFSFRLCDMYGVACAALGMLSTLTIGLTIDAYGPISDNAGGIAEMAGLDESVRKKTDALDAAGNTTAAIGKGFAIGSAALVSLALFGAFVTRTGQLTINMLEPIVFAFLLIGSMLPYWFSAMCMKSVGKAAQQMVEEVRRQFREHPGIMNRTEKPDYARCVTISTEASLHEMIAPGALVMISPLLTGFVFGPKAVCGLLAGGLVSGVQMAVSSSNTGGAWDNAKKWIEKGNYGGKGSEPHKAAVVGDTVGDPLKDTSGPSLNILMKLMAILSLVFADFFVSNSLPVLIASYGTVLNAAQ